MIHKQTIAGLDIDLFTNIYVDIIEKMVKYFKSHICALDFYSLLFLLLWPPVLGVCPNHEVVMFQHWTVTPPYIGSIVNCYVATPLFLTRSALLRPLPDLPLGGGARTRPWPLSCLPVLHPHRIILPHWLHLYPSQHPDTH